MATNVSAEPAEGVGSSSAGCTPARRVTRSLLGYGIVAGPFYVLVSLAQATLREGFDLTRHDWSLLANGRGGWIQSTNLVLTGLMVVAAAVGCSRSLRSGPGHRSVPWLLAGYGTGLLGAGIFRADPMAGFPVGTPAGPPVAVSGHGMLHLVCAGIGFLAFVVTTLVLARRFARVGRRGRAAFSIITGVTFLAAFAGVASGSSSPSVVLGFTAAVLLAWAWLSSTSLDLYRRG